MVCEFENIKVSSEKPNKLITFFVFFSQVYKSSCNLSTFPQMIKILSWAQPWLKWSRPKPTLRCWIKLWHELISRMHRYTHWKLKWLNFSVEYDVGLNYFQWTKCFYCIEHWDTKATRDSNLLSSIHNNVFCQQNFSETSQCCPRCACKYGSKLVPKILVLIL